MINYIIRRILYAIPILIGVNLLTFSPETWGHAETEKHGGRAIFITYFFPNSSFLDLTSEQVEVASVSSQDVPVMQLAQAKAAQTATVQLRQPDSNEQATPQEKLITTCQDVTNVSFPGGAAFNTLFFMNKVVEKLGYRWNEAKSVYNIPQSVLDSIKVTLSEAPQHGKIEYKEALGHFWQYTANPGYKGKDRVVFLAETQGHRFKVVVNLLVHEVVDEYAKPPVCERFFKSMGSARLIFAEKDWYGQDAFTYKLSDGRVDSSLVTVTLTVTPVNDAPRCSR